MASIAPLGRYRALDSNGDPLSGGKLYTYEAGTSTPKQTFTDRDSGIANTNPVILDSEGYADVWLDTGGYKFVLDDANDVEQWSVDNISGGTADAFASVVISKGSAFNLTTLEENNVIVCTASFAISLLTASTAGNGFAAIIINQSAGNVTIDPDGAETINGDANLVLPAGTSATIHCDGSEWFASGVSTVSSSGDNTFTGDNIFEGSIATADAGELTIATGAITVTGTYHTVDTESDAATDDLDTINGGSDGQLLILRQENDARVVTMTENGNILLPNGASASLFNSQGVATLIYDASLVSWVAKTIPLFEYGTSGDYLTSNGPGTAPTMQTPATVVDITTASTSTAGSTTTTIPADNTIPQNTEGDEILTVTHTPQDAANVLVIEYTGFAGSNSTTQLCHALFQDSTADALAAVGTYNSSNATCETVTLRYTMSAGTTSATTFKVRGGGAAGTFYWLRSETQTSLYGAAGLATLTVTEIKPA